MANRSDLTALNAEIAKLGKRANSRLRNLEKSGTNVKSKAYVDFLDRGKFKTKTRKNQIKFDVKQSANVKEARQRLREINNFLEDITSKVAEVRKLPADYSIVKEKSKKARKKIDISALPPVSKMTKEELNRLIGKLGKTANTRLRSLEKAGYSDTSKAYRYVARLAFDDQVNFSRTKKGQIKFNVRQAETVQEARQRLNQIIKFLSAKTSTPGGVKHQYELMAESLRLNSTFSKQSTEDIKDFWASGTIQEFSKNYGYDELMEAIEGSIDTIGLTAVEAILKEGMDQNQAIDIIQDNIDYYVELRQDTGMNESEILATISRQFELY